MIKQQTQFNKVDDFTLSVAKIPPTPEPIITNYTREFVENKIVEIQKQKDDFDARRDEELQEFQTILDEMNKQGITIKKEVVDETEVYKTPSESDGIKLPSFDTTLSPNEEVAE